MKKFLKDEKGGSLEVLFGVILLMFIFFATLDPVTMSFKTLMLEQAKMKGLDEMQIHGGLNQEIETSIKSYLKTVGFDESKIEINGTLAAVQWGSDVGLEINYVESVDTYRRVNLISFEKVEETRRYHVDGSTTSYYFNNN